MYQDVYFVPKGTGTLTDALQAYGLATLLRALIQYVPGRRRHGACPVQIEDEGASYAIRLPEAIQEEWLESSCIPTDLALPVLRVAKPKDETKIKLTAKPKPAKPAFPEGLTPIDYNAIWDGIRRVNALVEAQRQQGQVNWAQVEKLRDSLHGEQPHRDVALLIGEYRMQVEGIHNQAVTQWFTTTQAGYQAANLRAILGMFASPYSDPDAIAKAWAKEVKLDRVRPRLTASQVFNPGMGKGQNRPKADQLTMGNEDRFWLLEYLKAVGLFVAAAPRAFSDEDMRKTYVLAPAKIELGTHEGVFSRFKRTLSGLGVSPIKADILMSLGYAASYLEYCRAAKLADPETAIAYNPRNSVSGFYVADYMLLSQNSFTMINLSFLGLPPWLKASVQTIDDVEAVQKVIEEHRNVIRPLREKFQEEGSLLDTYRDFLTGQRRDAFFAFCAGYGEFVVRALADPQQRYIRQFSVQLLDEMFRRIDMPGVDLTEFSSTAADHRGFHRIAYAIRHSTVIPQRRLARNKANEPGAEKPLYDVRYGLGNNLRRRTDNASDFMSALAEFLQLYNAETAQVFENTSEDRRRNHEFGKGRYRSAVAIEDLDDVLSLVNKHGVQLVCNMLLAYGYATQRYGAGNQPPDDSGALSDEEQ